MNDALVYEKYVKRVFDSDEKDPDNLAEADVLYEPTITRAKACATYAAVVYNLAVYRKLGDELTGVQKDSLGNHVAAIMGAENAEELVVAIKAHQEEIEKL